MLRLWIQSTKGTGKNEAHEVLRTEDDQIIARSSDGQQKAIPSKHAKSIRSKGWADAGSIFKTGGYFSYRLSARQDAARPMVNWLLAMPLADSV
jgi:hypothetical protein